MNLLRTKAKDAPGNGGQDWAPSLPARQPPLSQEAANIGQRIMNLENELDQVTTWGQEEARLRAIAEGERDRLLAETDRLRQRTEFLTEKIARIDTKATICGRMALELLDEAKTIKPSSVHDAAALKAVEEVLPGPAPAFPAQDSREGDDTK